MVNITCEIIQQLLKMLLIACSFDTTFLDNTTLGLIFPSMRTILSTQEAMSTGSDSSICKSAGCRGQRLTGLTWSPRVTVRAGGSADQTLGGSKGPACLASAHRSKAPQGAKWSVPPKAGQLRWKLRPGQDLT